MNISSVGKSAFLPRSFFIYIDLGQRAFDGKCKVWSIDRRACVATHSETEKALWSVRWLPRTGRNEGFVTAGADQSISIYREATGG